MGMRLALAINIYTIPFVWQYLCSSLQRTICTNRQYPNIATAVVCSHDPFTRRIYRNIRRVVSTTGLLIYKMQFAFLFIKAKSAYIATIITMVLIYTIHKLLVFGNG